MPYDDFDTEDTGARWEPLSDDAWRFQNDAAGVSEVARSEVRPATGSAAARRAASAPASAHPAPRSAANPAAACPFGDAPAPEPPAYRPVGTPAAADQTVMRPTSWAGSRKSVERGRIPAGTTAPVQTASKKGAASRHRASAQRLGAQTTSAPQAASASAYRPSASAEAPERRAPRPRKRAKHGCLSFFLWIGLAIAVAFMALRCLPASMANGRAVPELVSLIPIIFVPLIVCLVLAVLWRRRVLAVLTVVALAVMGWWHAGYFIPSARVSAAAQTAVATAASADDNAARIMTLNTLAGRASAEEIVQIVREQHVEILCLQELSDDFAAELSAAGIDELLPYHVISLGASGVNNGGRNGIWTLAPMSNISQNLLPIQTSSMPAATITIGGRALRVVGVHPNSPVRGAQDLWEEGLSTIGSLSDYDHAYIIMGDFNSTWDHARFRELLGTSFVDASEQAGEGFHMTYPSNSVISPLVEIDHIVYARDAGLAVSDLETVSVSGTDHRALLATLEVQG